MGKKEMVLGPVLALLAFSAPQASPAKLKIGCVDLEEVFGQFEKTQAVEASLESEKVRKEKVGQTMVEDIRRLKEESELLSEEARREKNLLIDVKIKELSEFKQKAEQEMAQKYMNKRKEILEEINAVIEALGKEQGFTMIIRTKFFDQPVLLYKDAAFDLTQEVIGRLNRSPESSQAK